LRSRLTTVTARVPSRLLRFGRIGRFERFERWPIGLRLSQRVELVQFGLQQLLVRQACLILGNERRRHRPTQGIFNDFVILGRTKQNTDGRLLVRLLHVAVEGLQVELEFAQVFRLELNHFEFEGHKAVERPVEEE
jgi:hypothetical protein